MSGRAELAEAGDLLVHYIRCAWVQSGLKWDSDNELEVREALGHLVEAAVIRAKGETK